jgi:hypothetical protein
LLLTALSGAMYNVGVNIGSLKDAALVERIKQDVKAALTESGAATQQAFTSAGIAEIGREVSSKLGLPVHGVPTSE